uniref:Uncharacterized protein n=1 Tax=Macaca fascicularis TaxID=9541 RepID=Q2PG03_MACFA|nr:hypothetical protein [Macaca fascicularis]
MTKIPDPFPTPLHQSHQGAGSGEEGGWGSRPLRFGHRHRILIWTKLGQRHPSPEARAMPAGPTMEIQTPHQPAEWTL